MLKLHNSMWPGIVGKGSGTGENLISFEKMLDLTVEARVNNEGFDGIDINLLSPHLQVDTPESQVLELADRVQSRGLKIGSLGAPVWAFAGGGSSMGTQAEQRRFLEAVRKTCELAKILNRHGVRTYGTIRIDSADSPDNWYKNPAENNRRIIACFKEAAAIAAGYGERLAAEGEICWAGMHSWRSMLDILEAVGRPDTFGFLADLAHTYLYLLGYNAPEHALIMEPYQEEIFWDAYQVMTSVMAPWTIDFHVAQSNGTVFGSGEHDKTGRHCTPDAPDGRLDVERCARYWLLDEQGRVRNHIKHICWDGCMFPNQVLENGQTWINVLELMQRVRDNVSPVQPSPQKHESSLL